MNIQIELTPTQKEIYNNLIEFLNSNEREILLLGYAGTGKTTLVAKFVNEILNKKLCKKIAIVAPTHKAVNIAKSKLFFDNDKISSNIEIMTIHRLLSYQQNINTDGEIYYSKSKIDINLSIYNIIIVDECSMLSEELVNDLTTEINKSINKKLKIIYVGDPAQLPPVNQIKSTIFNKKIKKLVLNNIIRTKSYNIMNLSNSHRKWIESCDIKDMPCLYDFKDNQIKLYNDSQIWLSKYINEQKIKTTGDNNNIILTWTNKKCNEYNDIIRKKMFNKEILEKYEIGEILLFSDFHKITIINDDDDTTKIIKFYTSEQIILNNIKQGIFEPPKIKNLKNIDMCEQISNEFLNFVDDINKKILSTKYQIYEMNISRISDYNSKNTYDIMTIHKNSEKKFMESKSYFEMQITKLKQKIYKELSVLKITNEEKIKNSYLVEKKLNRIWKEWQTLFMDQFAQLNYGYSITVHKSQGSTFKNVFIDMGDIFKNNNDTEKIRCLYTAITRTSNSLHLLIEV